MTISQTDLMREAHRRGRANQPALRRRVNSTLAGVFGSGSVVAVLMAGLDIAPWWVMVIVATAIAVAEVLAQAFSKGPLTPSQEQILVEQAVEMESEANPEPTAEQVQLGEVQDDVRALTERLDRLIEHRDLEAQAAQAAARPDPDEELLRAYDEA